MKAGRCCGVLTSTSALIKERINSPVGVREMILIGKKVDATQGKALGIIDSVHSDETLFSEALLLAQKVAPKSVIRSAFGRLKKSTYVHVYNALLEVPLVTPPQPKASL